MSEELLTASLKSQIKTNIQEELISKRNVSDDEVFDLIEHYITEKSHEVYLSLKDKLILRKQIFYSIRGYDVLSELIEDKDVTEIMVNGHSNIFVEKHGKLIYTGRCFDSEESLLDIIQKIAANANRTVNMSSPIVDARLPDGSRVNAVLAPVSLDGPTLTIRRFSDNLFDINKLISVGAINDAIADLLKMLVVTRHNILISGGTGAGKTTFLNAISGYLLPDERIITIEDSAELRIQSVSNIVRLETRNSVIESCREITVRDLIKTALRMRPDRIIVGEVRGEEAIDMLQAFGVGMDGSMSTIHANSSEDALSRLETLILLNTENIPLQALRRQMASNLDIIIQLSRMKDHSRKLTEIREVIGLNEGTIMTNLLYEYRDGGFVKCGEVMNTTKLKRAGHI